MTLMDAALRYAERGFRVLPLHTPDPTAQTGTDAEGRPTGGCTCRRADCGSAGKHPRTRNGVHDATTDETTVRRWWMRWPAANVGIATGGGLLVLDMDPRHNGDDSLAELEERHGPIDTLTVETGGGGLHLYLSAPARVGNAVGIRPGLDIRGEGGFVVAPPSRHVSGRCWRWRRDVMEIAPAPEWLLRLIRENDTSRPRPAGAVDDIIPEGRRDRTLTSLAGTLRRRGLVAEEILACLEAVNARRCAPPLPYGDLLRIAESMERYEPAAPLEAS